MGHRFQGKVPLWHQHQRCCKFLTSEQFYRFILDFCPLRDTKLWKSHWFVWFISICSGWVQVTISPWSQMNWFPQRWWWDACERMFISSSFVRLIMLNQLKYLRKYNERKMNKMSDDRTGFISFSIFDKLEFCWLKQWEDQVQSESDNDWPRRAAKNEIPLWF